MFGDFKLLSSIIFSPLLGVLVLLFLNKDHGRAIKIVGIITTLIPLALSAWLYVKFDPNLGTAQFEELYNWITVPLAKEADLIQLTSYYFQFNYHVAIDGLSLPLVFLTALVSTMAALAAVHIKKRWKAFFILFLILETGMLGVFMAQDLFAFFVFFEMTIVPVFFLIGIWGFINREKAANSFLLYNGVGSAIMLIAFLILVNTAGFTSLPSNTGELSMYYSGNLKTIADNMLGSMDSLVNRGDLENNPFFLSSAMHWTLFIMMLVAFGIKLPIFPFHTWMLKVHTEAPASVVMIHSGILLKMGAYGLLRFGVLLFPEQASSWATVLAVLGVINILYGAVLAFRQNEFRLVLAYSSISHMGIVLLGIAAMNEIGLQGTIFQLVSHGLISALMFLVVGSIYERTETTDLHRLGGLARTLPFMGGMLLLAGMASLGLPLLSGFISEYLAFLGLFQTMPAITIIGTLGIIFTAVYVLRGIMRITYGPMPESFAGLRDMRLIETVPMIALAAFIVLLGIYPSVLSHPLNETVSGFTDILRSFSKVGG
jgi:NADH-quinone oxidoreductase subunit M